MNLNKIINNKKKKQNLNQVVLWDKIVLKGEKYKLNLKGAKTKYYFWDDGDGLRFKFCYLRYLKC